MEIQDIKQRLNIIEVARHLGIRVDQRTKKTNCPFHDDKTPSLQFSEEKNICTCFSGRCSAGTMDMISLTEKYKNISTHEAIKWLSKLAGEVPVTPQNRAITPAPHEEPDELTRIAILKKAFNHFENSFMGSNPARKYLESRGLNYQRLQVGYNNGTLHHGENKHLISSFESIGLLKKNTTGGAGYQVFGKGCLTFPLFNKQNQVSGLYFRAVEPPPKNMAYLRQEPHLYLKNRQGLYPGYPSPQTTKLIITESIIDAATLQDIPEIKEHYTILTAYGTNGLNGEHREAIKALKQLREIIFFFDGDEPGRKAAQKAASELVQTLHCNVSSKHCNVSSKHCNVSISIVETPEGEDINGLAQGHHPEIFIELLNKRKPFSFQKKLENNKPVSKSLSTESSNEEKKTAEKENPSKPEASAVKTGHALSQKLITANPYKITYPTQTAIYHVKGGLPKALDSLKVTLEIEHPETGRKSRTKPDLYEDKQVEKTAREAGEKLNIRADLLEMDLNQLTDLLDEHRESQAKEKDQNNRAEKVMVPIGEQQQCTGFLKQKQLIMKFNQLIEKAGITGEQNNRVFLFVIATSYKMPETLHALIQGSSGSGKTYLARQISDLMPPEDVIRLTRVTENSFYNYGEYEIQYKLIVLEDIDGMKEEAEFAFRELQSNGEIISSTSGKDETSGQIKAQIRRVRGPIGSIATTTRGEIYEDNMSRIFLLAVDESKQQTNRIIEYLNKKSSGMINKTQEKQTKHFIRNCIRMLKPYEVINPYANKILLPPEAHKIRRLTELFHSFIHQITLLNQYQRKKDQHGRLITEKEDVQTAIEIMFDSIILKIDELDGSLRQFYEDLKQYIISQGEEYQNYQFTQREIRQALNISKTQIYRYFTDLLELEYIVQAGGYANRGFKYKITYWDDIKALRERIKRYLNNQVEKL